MRKCVPVVLFVILILLGRATYKMYRTYDESVARKEVVVAEYNDLERRIMLMKGRVESLQTPEGRDAEIRRSFNVTKPGERVVIVVPSEQSVQRPKDTPPWYMWFWRGSYANVFVE